MNRVVLGVVSADRVAPAYRTDDLVRAAMRIETGVQSRLENPAGSPGCSPILRALLVQSGLPHSIAAELATDSESHGHQGGNAIDATAPGRQLAALAEWARAVPALFAFAAIDGPARLVIWDGAVVAAGSWTGPQAAFAALCSGHLHLASSASRLKHALPGLASTLAARQATSGSGLPKDVVQRHSAQAMQVAAIEEPGSNRW